MSIEITRVLNWVGVFQGNADECQRSISHFPGAKIPIEADGGGERAKWPYLIRVRLKDEGTAADVSCKLRVIGLIINSGQETAPAYSHGQIVPAVHYPGPTRSQRSQ